MVFDGPTENARQRVLAHVGRLRGGQAKLVSGTGVNSGQLSSFLNGSKPFGRKALVKIAAHMDMDYSQLVAPLPVADQAKSLAKGHKTGLDSALPSGGAIVPVDQARILEERNRYRKALIAIDEIVGDLTDLASKPSGRKTRTAAK